MKLAKDTEEINIAVIKITNKLSLLKDEESKKPKRLLIPGENPLVSLLIIFMKGINALKLKKSKKPANIPNKNIETNFFFLLKLLNLFMSSKRNLSVCIGVIFLFLVTINPFILVKPLAAYNSLEG